MFKKLVHLDKLAPSGNPKATANSFTACGAPVHFSFVTNVVTKVRCGRCRKTALYISLGGV